jgi:hypothetical protein
VCVDRITLGERKCMKIGTILSTINKHAAIYICLGVFFALSRFAHNMALMRMESCKRQFLLMNDETTHSMSMIDFVAATYWLAIVYSFLILAAVVFLQILWRPRWIYWLTAIILCIPLVVYLGTCSYIIFKF